VARSWERFLARPATCPFLRFPPQLMKLSHVQTACAHAGVTICGLSRYWGRPKGAVSTERGALGGLLRQGWPVGPAIQDIEPRGIPAEAQPSPRVITNARTMISFLFSGAPLPKMGSWDSSPADPRGCGWSGPSPPLLGPAQAFGTGEGIRLEHVVTTTQRGPQLSRALVTAARAFSRFAPAVRRAGPNLRRMP